MVMYRDPVRPIAPLAATEAATPANDANPAAGIVWDLNSYFPGVGTSAYRDAKAALRAGWEKLLSTAQALPPLTVESAAAYEAVYLTLEQLWVEHSHVGSYLGCLSSTDTRDEAVQKERGDLATLGATAHKAEALLLRALREASDEAFSALAARPGLVVGAGWFLQRQRQQAQWTMPTDQEMLAADLSVDGLSAWGRLYQQVSGTLSFELELADGTKQRIPMAQKREWLEHPDAGVRQRALHASNKAWEEFQDVAAACLNHICGTRLTLQKRRGVKHYLDVALFDGALEKRTLDALWQAVESRREVPQRFLRLKARLLGKQRLGFQDLHAPLPLGVGEPEERAIPWRMACDTVLGAFRQRYPALATYTQDFLERRFLEAEKRDNKRPGAFCTGSLKTRESRVFMTYGGNLNDLQTMAHELGHAWHSHLLKDARPFATEYPMTLAETASTFAEAILSDHLLEDPSTSAGQKARILNQRLSDVATYLLDIHMRFLFESWFHEERADGVLTPSRLKELMLQAETACFGETLFGDQLDEMFWASKLHFYITGVSFYNYPYTFGFLFSQALTARARREGPGFHAKYEDLLRHTGSASCEELAQRFLGEDIGNPAFWTKAIDAFVPDIEQLEALV